MSTPSLNVFFSEKKNICISQGLTIFLDTIENGTNKDSSILRGGLNKI